MTIRRIFLLVTLVFVALIAWRIAGVFMPHIWIRWLWWVLMSPFLLAGGVLAIVLLLLTILCLGRLRYSVNAKVGDNNTAYVEVSYLMRLVHFVQDYRDGKSESVTKIAGIRLGESKPRKKKRKAKPPKSDKHATTKEYASKEASQAISKVVPVEGSSEEAASTPTQLSTTAKPDSKKNDHTTKKTTTPESEKLEKEKKDRLKPLKQAKAVLTYPDRKIIMNLCLRFIKKLLKALKPKHLDIHGVVGFDDPCTTGWAMGAYEAAVGVTGLRHKVRILGNYLEKALELNIEANGRTRLWSLIWPFVWLYLHKPIRVVLHQYILK